jgi:hypothetical protein
MKKTTCKLHSVLAAECNWLQSALLGSGRRHPTSSYWDWLLKCNMATIVARSCRARIIRNPKRLFALVVVALGAIATVSCYRQQMPRTLAIAAPPVNSGEMSANKALCLFEQRAQQQLFTIAEYSDETVIYAEVPQRSEAAQASLRETFSAPQTLSYSNIRLRGSGFVKNNVIVRLLETDEDHVRRGMQSKTAILASNYKFTYRNTTTFSGRPVYTFTVTSSHRVPGLFQGEIFLDADTGHILRATGRVSKSPSWWVKRIDFTQDYADIGDFTLPVQVSSVTEARIVGRVIVTIRHTGYQVRSNQEVQGQPDAAHGVGGSVPSLATK